MNLKNNFDKGYLQNHKISSNFILHFGGKKKIQVKLDWPGGICQKYLEKTLQ